MRLRRGLALPELLVIAVFALVVVGAGWFFFHGMGDRGNSLVEISDGGSTNAAGWDLKINADGGGELHCDAGPYPCKSTTYRQGTFPSAVLSKDLATTNLKSYKSDCVESASFGEVETLIYHGQRTVGIDCYMQTVDTPLAQDLNRSLTKINP